MHALPSAPPKIRRDASTLADAYSRVGMRAPTMWTSERYAGLHYAGAIMCRPMQLLVDASNAAVRHQIHCRTVASEALHRCIAVTRACMNAVAADTPKAAKESALAELPKDSSKDTIYYMLGRWAGTLHLLLDDDILRLLGLDTQRAQTDTALDFSDQLLPKIHVPSVAFAKEPLAPVDAQTGHTVQPHPLAVALHGVELDYDTTWLQATGYFVRVSRPASPNATPASSHPSSYGTPANTMLVHEMPNSYITLQCYANTQWLFGGNTDRFVSA